MKIPLVITALTALLGFSTALPETVTEIISPEGSAAKDCLAGYDGNFQVAAVPVGKGFNEIQVSAADSPYEPFLSHILAINPNLSPVIFTLLILIIGSFSFFKNHGSFNQPSGV